MNFSYALKCLALAIAVALFAGPARGVIVPEVNPPKGKR
jgi:hypothetical protein